MRLKARCIKGFDKGVFLHVLDQMFIICFFMHGIAYYCFAFQPLERELDRLKNDTFNIPNITIVTPRLRQSVSDFAASGLDSVNFDQYFKEVSTLNIFMTMIIRGTLERKHNLERGWKVKVLR